MIEEGGWEIELNNLTDTNHVYYFALKLDEGKTYEDLLEHYGEPGAFKFRPTWTSPVQAMETLGKPNVKEFRFKPGNHVIICSMVIPEGERTWVGAPLEVKPASSD